jgi:hypothetical protein
VSAVAGMPLWELTPQELCSWGEFCARLTPRRHRIAFPPLRDIPTEAYPPPRSGSPKLQASQPKASPPLRASAWKPSPALEAFRHPMPSARQACSQRIAALPKASMQRQPSPCSVASVYRAVPRGGAWPPSGRMSRSGRCTVLLGAAQPRSNIVAKREARATSIRPEGGQAPPPTTPNSRIDPLESS